jgi:hypothetical protein
MDGIDQPCPVADRGDDRRPRFVEKADQPLPQQ